MHPWNIYALEVTRDRERRSQQRQALAEHRRRIAEAGADAAAGSSRIRRSVALVLAAFSRSAAAAVRRLDDCVADDLGRSLAPTE